LEYCQ